MTVPENEVFTVKLDGTAWTYTGVNSGMDVIKYEGKRYEKNAILFSLKALGSGEFELEFVREDLLTGETKRLLLKLSVTGDGVAAAGSATSPASRASGADASAAQQAHWPGRATPSPTSAAPSILASSPVAVSVASQAVSASASPAPPASPDLLSGARLSIAAGQQGLALAALASWIAGKAETEEYLWLLAQALEMRGPSRDVQSARDLYRRIVDEYPEGARLDEASARARYIDRFYLDIR